MNREGVLSMDGKTRFKKKDTDLIDKVLNAHNIIFKRKKIIDEETLIIKFVA